MRLDYEEDGGGGRELSRHKGHKSECPQVTQSLADTGDRHKKAKEP